MYSIWCISLIMIRRYTLQYSFMPLSRKFFFSKKGKYICKPSINISLQIYNYVNNIDVVSLNMIFICTRSRTGRWGARFEETIHTCTPSLFFFTLQLICIYVIQSWKESENHTCIYPTRYDSILG